ncbi:sulfite exporter TauE/SafE family protein [Acinetobacter rudis]|uniref:sulfite exporter TauE/SafE family protein n=1 Tax=Acinetobacter rudis TaxID=632955 RepID=UPI0033427733
MELYFLLLAAGCISGMLTILFGFAGGFVVVPLVYATIRFHAVAGSAAYELAFKSAIASSLLLMIINSGLASYQQYKMGRIKWPYVFPLAYWIAAGAVLGTFGSFYLSANFLKWAFVIYLAVTIADCMLRQIKQHQDQTQNIRGLTSSEQSLGGIVIGAVAAALGVGGSVMTVPLFRRCGLNMSSSVALANPLSMPLAIAGASTFIVGYWLQPLQLGTHFIGYFYYPALLCLVIGGYIGMKIAAPWSNKLSNRIHERGYIVLLALVLLSILLQ